MWLSSSVWPSNARWVDWQRFGSWWVKIAVLPVYDSLGNCCAFPGGCARGLLQYCAYCEQRGGIPAAEGGSVVEISNTATIFHNSPGMEWCVFWEGFLLLLLLFIFGAFKSILTPVDFLYKLLQLSWRDFHKCFAFAFFFQWLKESGGPSRQLALCLKWN